MKNFIKTNLKSIIISSLAILSPILFGLIIWNKLPEIMTIHLGITGEANDLGSRGFVVFVFPFLLLAIHWFFLILTSFDKSNKEQNKKVFNIIFWIIPITSIYVCSMIYSIIFGTEFNFSMLTFAFLGFLFILIGNYMPKCKRNNTIGIKIKWTLINEENWNATHRIAGKVWFIGGLGILALSFLPFEAGILATLPIIFIMVSIPTIYSYIYYKNQIKDGRASEDDFKAPKNKKTLQQIIIASIVTIATAIFLVIICLKGDIDFSFSEETFTIAADYYDDVTLKYDDITNVEYRESENVGKRVFGFGSPRLLMGMFNNSEFGNYTRYSYAQCSSCVVITLNEKILVINGADDEITKSIYYQLIEKCN